MKKVVWADAALEGIMTGNPKRMRDALKSNSGIDVDEPLKMVVDHQPQIGDTVERYIRRFKTVVKREYDNADEEEDIFMRNVSKMKEWTSKSYSAPSQQVRVKVSRVEIIEWVEFIVVKISVDKMRFNLMDPKTEKVVFNVFRGEIRKLGSVSPLLTEPHFLFGSLKLKRRVNRIIPASLYFKSIRVSDEETDGGGVYGRNIKLPHYHKDKLVACVGDTLVHIILKNDSMDNRQDLLDVLMNIGSFSEESVKALNSSNRTPLEEMNPPFFFKIPAYSYTYNAQVRWRALKAHVSEKFHTAADPTIGKLANDITATPEDYDKALHAWNHRSLCWVDVNDKDKDKQSLNKEKDELAPSLLCNQPDSIQINKIKPIPFVDGGVFRGCMIGHKRVQKREYPFLNKLKKNIKDSYEEQFQLTINSLLFCIEWDHKVKIIPRWQIVPEPELTCHVIKRRKWYNGLIFYNQHPLLVRNYIIKYSRYEINELKIKQEIINQQNLKDAFVKRSLLIHNHNVKMKELKQMKILKQFSQLDSENNSLENRLGNDSDEGKGTQLQLQLQDESQSSNRESVLENNEDNNNTNHTNHHKHTNEDADVSLTQDYEDGSHSVVVLGPVSRNDARRFPPISNHLLTSELLIVRKAEENPFLDDWQYEVFSPESLTDISTTMGKAVNSSSSTGKSNTRSYDWFHKEIEQLREAKKSLLERQELERKNSANQKSFDDKLPMSSFDRSGRMSMDQLISSYAF